MTIFREKIPGPIVLLDSKRKSESVVNDYFVKYHFDDYLANCSIKQITARIIQKVWVYQNKNQLLIKTKKHSEPTEKLKVAGLNVDLNHFKVFNRKSDLKLSPIEFKLLLFFISNPDTVLSRIKIATEVWGNTNGATLRIIDTHISNLRKKIEEDPKNPRLLTTVRGFGYLFNTKSKREAEG